MTSRPVAMTAMTAYGANSRRTMHMRILDGTSRYCIHVFTHYQLRAREDVT